MTCLLASILTLACDALAAIKPRSLDEVAAAIWDRAYATMQASAALSVPQSEPAETATERSAPGHSPASGVAGVGHPGGEFYQSAEQRDRRDTARDAAYRVPQPKERNRFQ